ncbi:MAG TPA: glycosyltransferase family 1 protein [Solirubrobacteraceae bacterium]|nr:glycosyltransferase family 1 protein [Solirubrobacteraceae bacterium]
MSSRIAIDRPLKVGLNLLFLGERAGGAGRYATELPGALLAAEPDTEVHVFVARDAPAQLRGESWAEGVHWVTLPMRAAGSPPELLAQFSVLPAMALWRRLDVLHSPANTGPTLTPGVASVISLLDLIWLHRGAEWEPSLRVQRNTRRLIRHCVRHADRVFAISHDAAEDLARTLGLSAERIDVTPLGVSLPTGPMTAERKLREHLDLGNARVLLCVAQKRPYKNLHRIVQALGELEEDVILVLPGSRTSYEAELRALAGQLGLAGRVRFPDWLSEEDLDGLYSLSSAFVLPSLLEGFGLPILEAMARELPVACSNVAALPEVAGDAALLFDPERPDEIAAAVRRLLADRSLAAELIARGRERVRHYAWRNTGLASLAGYRRAIAGRGLTRRAAI